MARKLFCDSCGSEITSTLPEFIPTEVNGVSLLLHVCVGSIQENEGQKTHVIKQNKEIELCSSCVKEAMIESIFQ